MRLLTEWGYPGKLSGTKSKSPGKGVGPALTSSFAFSSAASFAAPTLLIVIRTDSISFIEKLPGVNSLILASHPKRMSEYSFFSYLRFDLNQSFAHHMVHSSINEGLAGLCQSFIIFAQPSGWPLSILHNLCSTVDNDSAVQMYVLLPSVRKYLKIFDAIFTPYYFQNPTTRYLDPINQLISISSINPNELQSGDCSFIAPEQF